MIAFSAPFPPLSWWQLALQDGQVSLDLAEHYQKMSYRNRYYVASPQGKLLLSVPLKYGRNQRIPMADVYIDNRTDWQTQHWRSLVSLYNRSPFFQYLEHHFIPLFQQPFDTLIDFNLAGIELVNRLLGLQLELNTLTTFRLQYPTGVTDIRNSLIPNKASSTLHKTYYQVFADRSGFLPDCSVLDLMFCEGLQAKSILLP